MGLELALLLGCIVIGSRIGGMGMGTMGGIGLLLFVFIFRLPPGGPPVTVLGMILAVITALATMEAAGGLTYLVGVAEKVMRKRPQNITFVAPFVSYILIFLSGTQHVIYALLPVISEISRKSNIRPERPLSISVIASMQGLIASPISAATVALVSVLTPREVSIPQVMMITIPATLLAVGVGAIVASRMGKNLAEDPVYQEKLKTATFKQATVEKLEGKALRNAKGATFLFFATVAFIVLMGLFPDIRPSHTALVEGQETKKVLAMADAIIILMVAVAGVMMLAFQSDAKKAVSGAIMKSGIVAIISILGISWMGSSFFTGNENTIVAGINQLISGNEWLFGLGLFVLSVLLFSQAATIVTLLPVALALDIPTELILALYPAVNGLFFLPTYGTILAAVSFDPTGTTKIGKYLLNHSFMLPGLVTTTTAVAIALLLSNFL